MSALASLMPGIAFSAASAWTRSNSTSDSERTLSSHSVSREASRTFWPFLPIASESWSSGTITSSVLSPTSVIRATSAGLIARRTYSAWSGVHGTMSIRSPRNSCTTDWTRVPFIPMHAPAASTSGSVEWTPIFARLPGSRAAPLISTMPSYTSGTSCSKSLIRKPGWLRDSTICGPFWARFTS